MRTWWIIRLGNEPTILSNLFSFSEDRSAIGPYFSYKEAMQVLYRWSK